MKRPDARWKLLVVLLVWSYTLVGCQAVSANSSHQRQQDGLFLNTPTLDFGNVSTSGGKNLSVTIVNTTATPVTITGAAVSAGEFSLVSPGLPVTVAPAGNIALMIGFNPTTAGHKTASIQISSDAPNGSISLTLAGDAVDPGQLGASPTSLAFGNVTVGKSSTKSETVTNSGGSSVSISQMTVTGSGVQVTGVNLPLTLNAGQSVTFSVTFAPLSAGALNGSIAITSLDTFSAHKHLPRFGRTSGTTLAIPLTGAGVAAGQLSVTPTSVNFGNVQVGNSQNQAATLTNTGGSTVTVTQATATGAGFGVSGLSLPLTLTAGQSTNFNFTFAPQSAGSVTGNVAITSDASNALINVPVSGTGVTAGSLSANPASLGFGTVQVGSSSTLSETVTNTGGSSVTLSQATTTGAGFSISGLSLPVTLNAGQSTTFSVKFTPSTGGSASGNVAITSNAPSPTLNIPLTGSGVTPGALSANPTSLSFGTVQTGSSSTLSETLTNSGGSSVTISQATATGAGFSISGLSLPITLNAGQSTTFSVKFTPSTSGSASGNVAITSNAPNPTLNIPLTGSGVTPGSLSANPTSLGFGTVQTGNSATLPETLTNSGGSSVTITQATTTGTGFSLTGLTLPITLSAGQSTTFNVTFSPSSAGSASGNVAITSNAPNPTLNIPLTGTGVAPGSLSANPTSLSFGTVQTGSNATLSETLTNSGGSSVTITQATTTGTGFSISGLTLPITLNAGQSTTFSVKFAPTASGSVSGNVAITSNAPNPTLNIPLTGTGVAPGSLSANPTSLSFGTVQTGSNATLTETLTNSGGSSVTITQATTTGAGFSFSGLTLPITLSAGQSTSFSVTFAPTSAGSASGNIAITSNASNPTLNIPLTGTGVTPGSLSANPTSLSFGTIQTGNSSTLSETLTNSGGSSVTITQAATTGAGFSITGLSLPITLSAGQSASFSVTFAPTSAGSVSGNVAITSNGSNPTLNIPLSGTGATAGVLGANPSSLSFGNVQVNSSATLSETVTNSGGSSVTISQANVTGAGFSISGLTLPLTLTAGQSVTFNATFAPLSAGSASGNIAVVSNASNSTLNIALSGTGTATGTLAVSPTTLNFGNITVGTSGSLGGTLTASGASVTVTSASSSTSEFSITGLTFPFTLSAGQSQSFTVTFTPQASGAASATATFVSNASNSPAVQSLNGTGIAPPQHSVDLTWNPSTSQVNGYNIYRGTKPGGPYTKINTSLDASTSYTDSTVQAGQTYYYVTTGVDSQSHESGFSNEVQAVIPTP